ncbi:hypothetical protein ABTE36_20565, partial [Acinetobacter baumannii]
KLSAPLPAAPEAPAADAPALKVKDEESPAVTKSLTHAPIAPRDPSVAKKRVAEAPAPYHHTVTAEAPTLGEVAVYLYGSARAYSRIAQWNGIEAPF